MKQHLDFRGNEAHIKAVKQGLVSLLTTNLNPFLKGHPMEKLLKPFF